MLELKRIFPATLRLLNKRSYIENFNSIEEILNWLKKEAGKDGIADYIPDLAHLEHELYKATSEISKESITPSYHIKLNPTLKIIPVNWKGLLRKILSPEKNITITHDKELIGIWKSPDNGQVLTDVLTEEDLLALKIVYEKIPYHVVKATTALSYRTIDKLINQAADKGLIIKPLSKIRRPEEFLKDSAIKDEKFVVTDIFTIQWHITQVCDLHCKHCYDRSIRQEVSFEQAIKVLDDFWNFCKSMNVDGQVTFSGGNPLLHPRFFDIYYEAHERGFQLAIAGNPVSEEKIQRLLEIAKPVFYQVSLEGLKEENDFIRGKGNFDNVINFLSILKKYNIYSMVMLTLTERNIDHVIPLANFLKDKVDLFTFNRLAPVGEGATLRLPEKEKYLRFLEDYIAQMQQNPIMALKDNMFNILKFKHNEKVFGGCAGYGCGAAFNFLCILSDGQVHACRKLPSLLGNIYEKSLLEIYHSPIADAYRQGPESCKGCPLVLVCRGCMAVVFGLGKDPLKEKDPYCFI